MILAIESATELRNGFRFFLWFAPDRDFSIRVMKKYLRIDDKEILDDAYTFYSEKLEKIPLPNTQGNKVYHRRKGGTEPAGKESDAGEFCRSVDAARDPTERIFCAAMEKLVYGRQQNQNRR